MKNRTPASITAAAAAAAEEPTRADVEEEAK